MYDKADMVIIAGASASSESDIKDAARRLGAGWVSSQTLCSEGSEVEAAQRAHPARKPPLHSKIVILGP